ncbi:hypothetical protein D3C86_470650 [compost metagenome]
MRVKHVLPLAMVLAVGMGGAVVAQGGAPGAKAPANPALTTQDIQAFQREGSIAANLEGAYASAVQAHTASAMGDDQIALNQVFDARTRLMSVKNLKIADPDLERSLNDLINLTTLAQRRLSSRSPAANDALKELVIRFSQTMAALPKVGGGGGGGLPAPILIQKLAPELVSDAYRSLANAQVELVQGNTRMANIWLDEAQNQLQQARQAPGSERIQDLASAVAPAIQVAQMQASQNNPEALASTGRAIEQMANRLPSTR